MPGILIMRFGRPTARHMRRPSATISSVEAACASKETKPSPPLVAS
jgi:hypothetical protein